jgi:hypothetical protein
MILNQFNIYPRCSINKKNENHLKKSNSMATTSMDQDSLPRLKICKVVEASSDLIQYYQKNNFCITRSIAI